MSYLEETLKRANIQALREFLLYGNAEEKYTAESYEKRINKAYYDYVNIAQRYDDAGEDSELLSAISDIMTEHENIYMEIGIQAGFLLAKDIYSDKCHEDKPNADAEHKKMYNSLFEDVTKAIEVLQKAQCKTEEMYVRTSVNSNSHLVD